MPATKPSRPWRLELVMPSGVAETQHRSESETYRAVEKERGRISSGSSSTIRMRVETWSSDSGRWELFELLRRGIDF